MKNRINEETTMVYAVWEMQFHLMLYSTIFRTARVGSTKNVLVTDIGIHLENFLIFDSNGCDDDDSCIPFAMP